MQKLKILNNREKEVLLEELSEDYSLNTGQFKELVFLEDRDEIWVSSKDALSKDLSGLDIDSIGLLFARKGKETELTINAVQLFCNDAEKNIITLDYKDASNFIKGIGVRMLKEDGTYIVKYANFALDLGRVKDQALQRKKSSIS